MKKVDVVIVNWNTGELLGRCLKSLLALPERGMLGEIVVVDNMSKDDSVERARAAVGKSDMVTFIELDENVGFARGNNRAIKSFSGDHHVLLLNPDTEVRAGAILALANVLENDSSIGIVGAKLLNPDGSLQPSVRPFPTLRDFLFYMLKLGRVVQRAQENAYDYTKSGYVDQVMGAAFLIRCETLSKVGLLDEGFFVLFEEVDYCKRALEAGWKTFFTPEAEVMHVRAASFSQLVGWRKTWPWLKSSLYYVRKHFGLVAYIGLLLLTPVTFLLTIPASLWHTLLKSRNRQNL